MKRCQTVRTYAHLVKPGEIVHELFSFEYVLETLGSWDGGVMLRLLDMEEGSVSEQFYAAFDTIDVLA